MQGIEAVPPQYYIVGQFSDQAYGRCTMAKKTSAQSDIVIIGAGPAGLCMAVSLSRLGLACTVIEKQAQDTVANPAEDGREVALTHRSVGLLKNLDIWPAIAKHDLGQIKTAHVLNKKFATPLSFAAAGTGRDRLSYMVPNHIIRRAAYDAALASENVTLLFDREVTGVETSETGGQVTLADGSHIEGRLIVAADSRFSPARAMLGIDSEKLDFNKVMILAKMAHDKPHNDTAYEWFQAERTLAMLPLAGKQCSAVLTVEKDEARDLLALDDVAYAAKINEWFEGRHGKLKMLGKRHSYPLMATYATSFYAPSFILSGDAAVGMHPVTAHGFNFGLRSVETITSIIAGAQSRGQDYASMALLAQYNRLHRMATRPLYMATNFIATLFTRRDPLAGAVRFGLHKLASRIPFAQRIISRQLVDAGK